MCTRRLAGVLLKAGLLRAGLCPWELHVGGIKPANEAPLAE